MYKAVRSDDAFTRLTEQGDALRKKAVDVPREMDGCIPLSGEELTKLKYLLDKALVGMDHNSIKHRKKRDLDIHYTIS